MLKVFGLFILGASLMSPSTFAANCSSLNGRYENWQGREYVLRVSKNKLNISWFVDSEFVRKTVELDGKIVFDAKVKNENRQVRSLDFDLDGSIHKIDYRSDVPNTKLFTSFPH